MPLIQINNIKLNVLEINKEAPRTIIMIHGMFTNLSVFYFSVASELAKQHHVVLYDLRSHGLSERVKEGYNLETMSADLLALMKVLNIAHADLVGYSFGGLISLYTAIHFPEKVGKIAIIDSPITDNETDGIIEKYGNEFLEHYMHNYSASTNLKPGKRQLEKNKQLFNYLMNETTMPQDLVIDKDFSTEEAMKSVKQETLLLYGKQSDCLLDGKFLSTCIPNAVFYEGEGDHNIPIQNPEWLSEKMVDFFK